MRILIACGGSAGHIFPGLALVEELKTQAQAEACQIVIVMSKCPRDKKYLKAVNCFEKLQIESVGSSALPYRISFGYIPFAFRLIWALVKSLYIILRYRPEVVVGFGGHTSFAPLLIAHLIGIPTLIHEQNVFLGRANHILAKISDRIAVSFDSSTRTFIQQGLINRVVKTGLPLRKHILTCSTSDIADIKNVQLDCKGRYILGKFNKTTDRLTILVAGGSQGAHYINELVLNCLNLMDKAILARLRLIHIAGKSDWRYVEEMYAALNLSFCVFDFLEDIAVAYKIADLLIARSGAGTIFEAAIFGLPCILVPYPTGTKHQNENALYLEARGKAIVLDEQRTSPQDLSRILIRFIEDKKLQQDLSQGIKMLATPQAGCNLKEEVFALAESYHVYK